MMTKSDTILEIMRLNRSADAQFLSEFSEEQLAGYLDRLSGASSSGRSAESTKPAMPTLRAVAGAA